MTSRQLIDLLSKVKDLDKELSLTAIVGLDSNSRNKYEYFYKAELWDEDITHENPKLVLS